MAHLLLALIYISFISLGLPDGLLGSGWPSMYPTFSVPVSYAGIVSVIISAGTILSSLMASRFIQRLGACKITAYSVALTAVALFGFSISPSFPILCFWAIPYGLGAGCVDAALNHYIAIHYESRHMSWLHCMWGVGASVGPYIMACVLTGGQSWVYAYRYVAFLQIALTIILFLSTPLWKHQLSSETSASKNILTLREIFTIPGAKEIVTAFFFYSAVEQTAALWGASYLVLNKGLPAEAAAGFASLFFIGITIGRAISGFITLKLNDTQMIRLGFSIIAIGIAILFLPSIQTTLSGLILIGLGCAPIYPCIIHSTPAHFGADRSQAMIGVQMAFAYSGTCLMPPLFGLIANHIHIGLFPVYLLLSLLFMVFMHEMVVQKTRR